MKNNDSPNVPWWQPGLRLFLRLNVWIIIPILVGVIVGKKLDSIFHTAPWLFFLCVAISFAFSMFKIIRIGLREMNKE